MCESNGRLEQIKSALTKKLGLPIAIELRLAAATANGPLAPDKTKMKSQRQNEIINDPAVKTVLMGLDATVTNIEDA